MPFRNAEIKHVLELLARKRLSTRWAKYPFSRCRTEPSGPGLDAEQLLARGRVPDPDVDEGGGEEDLHLFDVEGS